ncbi:transcriptional regulator, AraC family [Clostridium sp. DL-VIII]|uniref:AraC family transcriptional regulator n=1 Tax=Clostridium sp. DL-VIII TaxID=641107 RepID=UPI00023B0138|nr:AraC family transcriptional regulator [Clostridium sp. DL-VIII]EHJ00487.1 transcriptional regulator, AraC family [Clostridium sp. DL-VIII]
MNMLEEHTIARKSSNSEVEFEEEISRLAHLIYTHSPYDGSFNQRIPGLHVNRYSRTEADIVKTFQSPFLLLVVQGEKVVTLGKEIYKVGRSRMLMFPVALPVAFQTTQASPSEPFLSVGLELDPERIAELTLKAYPQGLPPIDKPRAGYIADADFGIINAVKRLIECLANPDDTKLFAPLVLDEILLRVLRSNIGANIAEIGFENSSVQRIAKAIDWLRDNFSQQIKVADLSQLVHMSESSFYEYFKLVTSLSPLQYQKALRLHEARRLMVSSSMDATTACRMVGYVSDSQFSRDYSRFFGNPPKRDVISLLQK